jgi:hypothetical protein
MTDRDPELLNNIGAGMTKTTSDGTPVTVMAQQADLTRLRADDLNDTSLVTASALLDLLTADEVEQLATACVTACTPALLALSVVGRVDLDPPDPLDDGIAGAFNAHQQRTACGRRLLGPDAVKAATTAFERRGARLWIHPSPWRLSADQAALTAEWLRGWVAAACEQRPDLAPRARTYLRSRLEACAAGQLGVVVHHSDVLALPTASAEVAP